MPSCFWVLWPTLFSGQRGQQVALNLDKADENLAVKREKYASLPTARGARKISRTLQDQSPTDVKLAIDTVTKSIAHTTTNRDRSSPKPSSPASPRPRPPPAETRPVPVFAKADLASAPAVNPVVPPRSVVNHHLRPWTDAEDHELVTFKSDTRARPAWKTIGLRLKQGPGACKARLQVLRQDMPELNSRTEPETEAKD